MNTGRLGETIAKDYLIQKGYRILKQNFRTKQGEIDIIAQIGNKLSFVEVKTRIDTFKGKPYEAVDFRKLTHIKKAAQYFLLQNDFKNYKLSVDVVSIILNNDSSVRQINYFEQIEI